MIGFCSRLVTKFEGFRDTARRPEFASNQDGSNQITYKLIITVTHLSNGKFMVSQNLTAPLPKDERPCEVFDTRDEAEACVEQLVAEKGGPDMVNIFRYANRPKSAP